MRFLSSQRQVLKLRFNCALYNILVIKKQIHTFYKRYVDDIFVLFESAEHLSKFCHYFNTCHPNIPFPFEQEKNGNLSFLDVEVSRKKEIVSKFGIVYTLAYRCFKICSDWTKFHEELSFLKVFFLKKRVPHVIY